MPPPEVITPPDEEEDLGPSGRSGSSSRGLRCGSAGIEEAHDLTRFHRICHQSKVTAEARSAPRALATFYRGLISDASPVIIFPVRN
ncbi:hypothetical protein FOZ63_011135, partial [Perkinsus olseni]